MRLFWYGNIAVASEEETQKRGVVVLIINIGQRSRNDAFAAWKISPLSSALPVRHVGVHFCYDKSFMTPMVATTMYMVGKYVRARFRSHCGK